MTTKESGPVLPRQNGYRGRVRSGCLTCRSRKIKCDELRPICINCTKFGKRSCIYKSRRIQQPVLATPFSASRDDSLNESVLVSRSSQARKLSATDSVSQNHPNPVLEDRSAILAETSRRDEPVKDSWQDVYNGPNAMSIIDDDLELDIISPSNLISRDIKLTTTMDILTAGEVPFQLSFSFFIETVDCPWITPYDSVNWQHMKVHMVEIGMFNNAVASAILAVTALYKGQLYSLPLSRALSLYHSSKIAYEKLLSSENHDFSLILMAAFLLCVFQFVHYETLPILKEPSEEFLRALGLWAQNVSAHSELSSRIVIWLRLLHVTTIRGGGMGLLSDSFCSLLPHYRERIPNISLPSNHRLETSTQLFQMLSTPIFEFYFELQMISGGIAKLTHYHRSRTTGADQEEVVQEGTAIKARLHALWERRSTTQSQTPNDLRSNFAPKIANSLISLIGVCSAAYYAELVEMERVLGDPVSESIDSKQAICRIREVIEGDWNAYEGGKLNPGYLRPLFLYAIECMNHDETRWAVENLEQIRSPIYRSNFFATFVKALSDAQLRKGRRVTSKYFCIWYFGVVPPFM